MLHLINRWLIFVFSMLISQVGSQFIWYNVLKLLHWMHKYSLPLSCFRDAFSMPLLDHWQAQRSPLPPHSLRVQSTEQRIAYLSKKKWLVFDFLAYLEPDHTLPVWGFCNQLYSVLCALSHSENLSADMFLGWSENYLAGGHARRDWLKWWSSKTGGNPLAEEDILCLKE